MKKYALLLLTGIFSVTAHLHAQKKQEKPIQPSKQAKEAFETRFAHATQISWEKEGSSDFEVNFKNGNKEMSAVFDAQGKWKETETEMPAKALPAKAIAYLNQHYAGKKIEEVAKIEKADGTINYEAEVNKKDILFDAGGQFIK